MHDTLNELRDVRTWAEVVLLPTALFGMVAVILAAVGG
jgi:hypothetical protein